eukprot:TRINITY_DN8932_c0_g1_i1.p1 TRINITY_DN8932_c0_g1~~TRINITY_DN8932_c0_g1_i1.p1  ORF type:complete len:252 (+),score=39.15 TRINITY_DN8932_c0_g1_i1:77-832(+)
MQKLLGQPSLRASCLTALVGRRSGADALTLNTLALRARGVAPAVVLRSRRFCAAAAGGASASAVQNFGQEQNAGAASALAVGQKASAVLERWLPGDWLCESCGSHNFRKFPNCRKCGAEKVGTQSSLPPGWCEGQDPNGTPYYWMEKDPAGTTTWERPKSVQDVAPAEFPQAVLESFNRSSRVGDWLCANCHEHNYASRNNCRNCQSERNAACKTSGKERPGDWVCPSCQNYNYGKRATCYKCSLPKPDAA